MVEILKNTKFRNYGHVVPYQWPQMGSEISEDVTLDTWTQSGVLIQDLYWVYPFFSIGETNFKSQDIEMLPKPRKRALLW